MFMSFDQIVDDMLLFMFDEQAKRSIRNLPEADLMPLFAFLYTHICKRYRLHDMNNPLTLLDYEPDLVFGVDVNPKRPEAVSYELLHSLWKRMQ